MNWPLTSYPFRYRRLAQAALQLAANGDFSFSWV
jgi:hypothetical protein